MSQIVLARVDDRLIHGQVMTAWLQFTGANHIVIIDDVTANDEFLKSVMEMSIPRSIKFNIFNTDDGKNYLLKDQNQDKLLLLAKAPETYLKLIENGANIKKVIVGGMGANKQRTKLYKNISASESERETFRKIINHDIEVKVQIIPTDKAIDVAGLLK
ncbi:PTS sugar transporter subunit IIB [Sporolactobacillus sp. KGMB 08714]|uniref:PTS sugar transporter subunit IIB n=1 Tax=Sporolactobacillus sp. KGMB 08714 TaxID=3064704 RepID=UPI002FBE532B